MTYELTKLMAQLDDLAGAHERLGEELTRAAEDLRAGGVPLAGSLIDEVLQYGQDFAVLRIKALEVTDEVGANPGRALREFTSLENLRAVLKEALDSAEAVRASHVVRSQAMKVLAGVEAIRHIGDADFRPLTECQDSARRMRLLLEHSCGEGAPQEAVELAEGRHPLAALFAIVAGRDTLDDERWAALHDVVEETFGRPLAVAISRGKLYVGDEAAAGVDRDGGGRQAPAAGHGFDRGPDVKQEKNAADEESVDSSREGGADVTGHRGGAAVSPVDEGAGADTHSSQAPPVEPIHGEPVHTVAVGGSLSSDVAAGGKDAPRAVTEGEIEEGGAPAEVLSEISVAPDEVVWEEGAPLKSVPVYGFSPEEDSATIAAQLLREEGPDRTAKLGDLAWRLLHEDRAPLAYHLVRALTAEGNCRHYCLAPSVVRPLVVGPHVLHPTGELSDLLKEDFGRFTDAYFVGENSEWDHALRFLLIASSLRPALLAPTTYASTVLHELRLKDGLDQLYSYCSVMADHGDKLQPLDTGSLKRAGDQAVWEAALASLAVEVETWWARAPQRHTAFHQATRVWRSWLEPGELIHELIEPVRRNDTSRLDWARAEVLRLTDDAVMREAARTDRHKLGRRIGQDITAKAAYQLRGQAREAVDFLRRWAELHENTPGAARGFLQQQAERLRGEVRSRHAGVAAELEAFGARNRSLYVAAALRYCRRALDDVLRLFNPEPPLPAHEPPASRLLNADLLRIPTLALDEAWEPEGAPYGAPLIYNILRIVAAGEWDWRVPLAARAERRDHEGTLHILKVLKDSGADEGELEELTARRATQVEECRAALRADVEDTRRHVGDAVAFGLLREQEHNELAATISGIEMGAAQTLRFYDEHAKLRDVRERIIRKREEEKESVRQRVAGLRAQLGSAPEALERIELALDRGDVLTANEYIEMTLAGRPLPESSSLMKNFGAFFPQTLRQLTEYLEQPGSAAFSPNKAVAEIRQYATGQRRGYSLGPVEMDRVPGSQARQAADLLQAWFTAKKAQRVDEPNARAILDNLGFSTSAVAVRKQGRRTWIDFDAEQVRDRNRCPVPQYGSTASGRYRVMCVWERPSEEDLLGDVGDTSHGRPVLLFYFGRMTEPRRREIARLCRDRRRTFVVVDDALVCYLCGARGSRLRVLFDCSLPFTFLEPYTATAGLVPPEMFYGRERERDSVVDVAGSCFIYGGRQLGKTALLRDVERTFNSPAEGKVALWLDLKSHGIGYDRPVDDLWSLLAGEFKRVGVVPPATPGHVSADKLLAHVQAWLEADHARRIILLLDESDRFLEYDGKEGHDSEGNLGFVRAARLKGLMDRTDRRFKVVLAGLHNVQRTTKLSNHPIAHFGETICIGPLLDEGESRAARDLVEQPLASLGYTFESPDLVTRILSQTNYYPSLIQLYCSHLLRHMTARGGNSFDPRTSPPYVITSKHVEEAYKSQDLRKAIRDRFIWTLQLDQRYEVIAYAIALYTLSDSEHGMVDGFDVEWVRRQALDWWPEGFRSGASENDIRTLLEEMVGLGILRLVGPNRYALRSANILLLMGTEEEISHVLESNREPALEYEPATFRSALRDGESVDPARRNPLTASQESELRAKANGVSIAFASQAAGIDDLRPFLRASFGEDFFIDLDGVADRAAFERRLSNIAEREQHGTTLIFVPASCPWSESWVECALKRVEKLKSKTSFARVLFVADAATTWQLVTQRPSPIEEMDRMGVTRISLRPWHDPALRQWADDAGLPVDKSGRDRIAAVTGRWPALIKEFYRRAQAELPRWDRALAETESLLKEPGAAGDFACLFGLDRADARRVLKDMATLGPVTVEDLAGVVEGADLETITACVRWAELLNLVTPAKGGEWQVDPLVGRLLDAAVG